MKTFALVVGSLGLSGAAFAQQLPPVRVPAENPLTEPKRILGKILFWDEQLSSDNTVSCGTCHSLTRAGTEARQGVHPGPDGIFPSVDDIFGSRGVVRTDGTLQQIADPIFGLDPQVTRRAANAVVGSAFAPLLFWDGRAGTVFVNPQTGSTSILDGGALENQALAPILSDVEMAHEGRGWADVAGKLSRSEPLGHATRLPPDLLPVVASHASYGDLFAAAFGDSAITAERIAFAIASYERTLVANQTPWDRFIAGDPIALTQGQIAGWDFFRQSACAVCHTPPFFTDHTFRAIGVRPVADDNGRQGVTGLFGDRGRFKVPTLRNVGLKRNFMHNGRLPLVRDVIGFYRPNNPARFPENVDPLLPVGVPLQVGPALEDFLVNGLRDARVANGTFPFDQPAMHAGALPELTIDPDGMTLRWPALAGVTSYVVYRGSVADLVDGDLDGLPDSGYGMCLNGIDPNPSDTILADPQVPAAGSGFFYVKGIIDGGIERGLGTTSSGRIREVAAPCP